MSHLPDRDFFARMAVVVEAMAGNTALETAVTEGVNEFFGRYRNLERTRWAEAIATVVTFERLTAAPENADITPRKIA